MNRHTGKVVWSIDAKVGFIHNCIAAGDNRVFCLDGLPPYIAEVMRERHITIDSGARLMSLDVRDGEIVWENTETVFGSWLGYSTEHDVLLQGYRKSRDMVPEPGDRMATHQGKTGKVIWEKKVNYSGPCILNGERIITQETAFNLLTGERLMREHPLTGEAIAWEYQRNYGCNVAVGSRNLLTFRSAAAGYFDLATDGGTGNFGGFKSGCTPNLIVANGVLNAPEYTRTCTCSYQNQTSLAMVHMPEVETWTFNPVKGGGEIRRVGINFGAPGDRKADNGTLWLDYPSRGGPSPSVGVSIVPDEPKWFRRHSSRIREGRLKWVEASGAKGLTSITLRLVPREKQKEDESGEAGSRPAEETAGKRYTVRMHFAEPDNISCGGRVFDIAVEDKTVVEDFDIFKEAGGRNIGIVREFGGVQVRDTLTISLRPKAEDVETVICGILRIGVPKGSF